MGRPIECRCDPRFTCGFCLRNAKPYVYTPTRASFTPARCTACGQPLDRAHGEHFASRVNRLLTEIDRGIEARCG